MTVYPEVLSEELTLQSSLSLGEVSVYPVGANRLRISFPTPVRVETALDPRSYSFQSQVGFPISVLGVYGIYQTLQNGSSGLIGWTGSPVKSFDTQSGNFTGNDVGDYLLISGVGFDPTTPYSITSVLSSTAIQVDRFLSTPNPDDGSISWSQVRLQEVELDISKITGGQPYLVHVRGQYSSGESFLLEGEFIVDAPKPRVASVTYNAEWGGILVTYSDDMRFDSVVTDMAEYQIVGPSTVTIRSVRSIDSRTVLIEAVGFETGDYTLEVNASGTPKDLAGNPIDPAYNALLFSSSVPTNARSIFVDKGPIARPPLTLHQGSAATTAFFIAGNFTTVNLPGANVGAYAVGKYLSVSGSAKNDGNYRISAILSPTQVRVKASFSLPDGGVGPVAWTIYDPRDGQIADDPTHVTVRVNGFDVVPEAVVGLLGQVVLPTTPAPTDTVDIDYHWIANPVVDIQRLNSREFRLNAWNRDTGALSPTQHVYRYNNVLVRPSDYVAPSNIQSGSGALVTSPNIVDLPGANVLSYFVGLTVQLGVQGDGFNEGASFRIDGVSTTTQVVVSPNPLVDPNPAVWSIVDQQGNLLTPLDQPLKRDLKYRAYERAYTAALNDPNLLVFNTPTHRIAYPPMQRTLESEFINYQPVFLPENDPTAPWIRKGVGSAAVVFNRLQVQDTTSGPFPTGNPFFWTRDVDLTFPNAFALSWQLEVPTVTTSEGIWTGLVAGYSNDLRACVVGLLDVAGVKKIGVLKAGFGDDPSTVDAWSGGLDTNDGPTGLPTDFDWSTLHSYRIYRSPEGVVSVFFDGDVVPSLRITETELPFLEELNDPFDQLQDVFFGSLSRYAITDSTWDFVRYLTLPTNPMQSAPSKFVSYEGNILPEVAADPWTPVGFHGTETTLLSNYLLLDSTSATDLATESLVGLVGGDFKGFARIEPLLEVSSDVILDINLQIRTLTHGITPNAVMAAIDDGERLLQLSFFADQAAPKYSYGGRSLPTASAPVAWTALGTASATMVGRLLQIEDTTTTNGLLFYVDDLAPVADPARVVGSNDYILEFRSHVLSYTADVGGFCGVTMDAYDSLRAVGVMLQEVAGVRYVTFHSDGSPLVGGNFAFEWADGQPHTYRVVKDTVGDLVSLSVDGTYVGSIAYSMFLSPPPSLVGVISFGSSTAISNLALSKVNWYYANAWRVLPQTGAGRVRKYVGFWKGYDPDALTGYHLPIKTDGRNAGVAGNSLGDALANFVADGVVTGDKLVVDNGPNKGTYEIATVLPTQLTFLTPFPLGPSVVDYRVVKEIDWAVYHKYRISRTPEGSLSLLLDANPAPEILIGYNSLDLPPSSVGIPIQIAGGLSSILWGAFDPTNLSQTSWDYVHYGITRSPIELRIVPHHEVLNQRNVIASPEHIMTSVAHSHTDFWSSSTGIPPQTEPDFLRDTSVPAYTQLNEGTPLVPATQTYEIRGTTILTEFVSAFNRPEDVLNNDGDFVFNDGSTRSRVVVPDDVLYNALEVIETSTGSRDLLTPFCDGDGPQYGTIEYQKEVCLTYDADVLPEDDSAAPTPWSLVSDVPANVTRSAFSGELTYGTVGATRTVYKNPTPLTDAPSLVTEIKYRIKVVSDTTLGIGDSQIRLGFSSSGNQGMTLALAFQTMPLGDRYVVIKDLNSGQTLAGALFDWLDGNYHEYRVVRDPGVALVSLYIDY